jgi:hypothetical protein
MQILNPGAGGPEYAGSTAEMDCRHPQQSIHRRMAPNCPQFPHFSSIRLWHAERQRSPQSREVLQVLRYLLIFSTPSLVVRIANLTITPFPQSAWKNFGFLRLFPVFPG